MSNKNKDCRACANCYLDMSDINFICDHIDSEVFGKLTRIASSENGHCGIDKTKFEQHPNRQENRDLKL